LRVGAFGLRGGGPSSESGLSPPALGFKIAFIDLLGQRLQSYSQDKPGVLRANLITRGASDVRLSGRDGAVFLRGGSAKNVKCEAGGLFLEGKSPKKGMCTSIERVIVSKNNFGRIWTRGEKETVWGLNIY